MNKSFKTTTLIAAIGMSAAALFFGAEFAMSHWLGMCYITVGSLAFLIIMITAAIITPPDLMTLVLVTIPLYLLYEVSIVVARRVRK